MNVIKKYYDNLPKKWQNYIKEKNWFDLSQFNGIVHVELEDGSHCVFLYAFYVNLDNEYGVFTEHSGYYIFPIASTKITKYSMSDPVARIYQKVPE